MSLLKGTVSKPLQGWTEFTTESPYSESPVEYLGVLQVSVTWTGRRGCDVKVERLRSVSAKR